MDECNLEIEGMATYCVVNIQKFYMAVTVLLP